MGQHENASSKKRENVVALALAVGVALVLAILIWQVSAHHTRSTEEARHRAQDHANGTERRIERACGGTEPAAMMECVAEQVAASREDQRAEYDLSAQQRMADWALLSMIAAVFTTALTAVALWFVKGTLEATQKAVEDTSTATDAMLAANVIAKRAADMAEIGAAEQAELFRGQLAVANRNAGASIAMQRPWLDVAIEFREPDVRYGQRLSYQIRVTNAGHNPALRVRVVSLVRRHDMEDPNLHDLSLIIRLAREGWSNHPMVFPGKPIIDGGYAGPMEGQDTIICVCAAYRMTGSDEDHLTAIAFYAYIDGETGEFKAVAQGHGVIT